MSKFYFELNRGGVRSLLRSQEMMNECERIANGVAQRAGDGYSVTTRTGASRVNAQVAPSTPHAYYSNLKNNTLLKALR